MTEEQHAHLKNCLERVLAALPPDSAQHEEIALGGAALGVLYSQGWKRLVTRGDEERITHLIQALLL